VSTAHARSALKDRVHHVSSTGDVLLHSILCYASAAGLTDYTQDGHKLLGVIPQHADCGDTKTRRH
jgi:hypothetical protein